MSDAPLQILGIYAALAVWIGLLIAGLRSGNLKHTLYFGIAVMLYLNVHYLIAGVPAGIAHFISIFDWFDNIGVAASQMPQAMATCPENACSLWGEEIVKHQSWGVSFYDRFANGPELRSNLLYAHLAFNSIVFVLMHIQIARPAGPKYRDSHRLMGRISFACLTLGTICAVWLASEHDSVTTYGGALSKYGFYFMSLCVYSCAVLGVMAIRSGNAAKHRVWMFRFAGSMWGAFWIFRLMLIFTGPMFREYESVSLLMSIWLSAPIGIGLAELIRRRIDKPAQAPATSATAPA